MAAKGRVLLDEALPGEWQVQVLDVGAPTPALLLQNGESTVRAYLYDPASGRLRLLPWVPPDGRGAVAEFHHAGLALGPGGPLLVVPRGKALDHRAAGGHQVACRFVYDSATGHLVSRRLWAVPDPGSEAPAGRTQLLTGLLESLTAGLPGETAVYFQSQSAARVFLDLSAPLPRDAEVTQVEWAALPA